MCFGVAGISVGFLVFVGSLRLLVVELMCLVELGWFGGGLVFCGVWYFVVSGLMVVILFLCLVCW